jgi:hypothetical protein
MSSGKWRFRPNEVKRLIAAVEAATGKKACAVETEGGKITVRVGEPSADRQQRNEWDEE